MAEWPTQAADAIDRVVASVREKAVVPAQRAGRFVVFGIFITFVGATALLLLGIAVFRLLAALLPVWAAWLLLGGLLIVAGALCWRWRAPKELRG